MTTINSDQFGEICDGVWRDRAAVLRGSGLLSGEAALVRAVFWRLCKAGVKPAGGAENYGAKPTILSYQLVVSGMLAQGARPPFDGAPILKELVDRYQNEVGPANLSEENKYGTSSSEEGRPAPKDGAGANGA
jgi:hypothetical protein